MRAPEQFARRVEDHPALPPGDGERVSGYGVMGLPFRSGHVLGLRRWTASSIGESFTSIWYRDPEGTWTFYESARCEIACSRYFGADVARFRLGAISLDWQGSHRLHVTTGDAAVDWTLELGATPFSRALSAVASALPERAWQSAPLLHAMGPLAGRMLGVGKVRLTGLTSNAQHFQANPLRLWYVIASTAVVEGQELGPTGPLAQQAHMADFYFPQRGLFAVGRVFITPVSVRPSRESSRC